MRDNVTAEALERIIYSNNKSVSLQSVICCWREVAFLVFHMHKSMLCLDRHSWLLLQDTEEMVCTLHYWLPAKIELRELGEALCWIMFVLLGDLLVDSGSENIPFLLWERATKSGHSFGTFSSYPVVLSVKRFCRIYVIFHFKKNSEIRHKEFEYPMAIRWACIKDSSILSHYALMAELLREVEIKKK